MVLDFTIRRMSLKPGVVYDLINCESLFRVLLEHPIEQVFGFVAKEFKKPVRF